MRGDIRIRVTFMTRGGDKVKGNILMRRCGTDKGRARLG